MKYKVTAQPMTCKLILEALKFQEETADLTGRYTPEYHELLTKLCKAICEEYECFKTLVGPNAQVSLCELTAGMDTPELEQVVAQVTRHFIQVVYTPAELRAMSQELHAVEKTAAPQTKTAKCNRGKQPKQTSHGSTRNSILKFPS